MSRNYKKGKCIGKGSFGEVYHGVEVETGNVVALKLQDLEKAQDEIDIIRREIQVMSQISSPYVVRYYTSFIEESTLWLVMEHMAGGSLKGLLDAVGPFPEDAIAHVMKSLCKGLEYIHKEESLHRDIKAENILLGADGAVKLSDFGVAGQLTNTLRQRNTFVGSPYWMAPEVITESVYDEKCDIWSVGITALELANGLPPHANDHPYKALVSIPLSSPPRVEGSKFSSAFKDFVSVCLQRTAKDRADASTLVGHPFLKKGKQSAMKDLMSKKAKADGKDGEEDACAASPVVAEKREQSTDDANGNAGGTQFSFDFGSMRERPDDLPPTDAAAVEDPVEQVLPEVPDKDAQAKTDEAATTNPEENASANSAPASKVLSGVFLPVLSTIRARAAEGGTADHKLMAAVGALEVAFVDVESAKPGTCELFFRSLLEEAHTNTSKTIREAAQRKTKR